MADLSDQQMLLADAAEGTRICDEQERKGRLRDFVRSLLAEVSEEDRILLTLKEIEGLSLKELQQIYGASENALKVRLFRARRRVLRAYRRSQAAAHNQVGSR